MNADWNIHEIRAVVHEYEEMLVAEMGGIPYVKKAVYRRLHAGPLHNRSLKSIEDRMRNISYVFQQIGLPWVPGLKPLDHVGPQQTVAIKRALIEDAK